MDTRVMKLRDPADSRPSRTASPVRCTDSSREAAATQNCLLGCGDPKEGFSISGDAGHYDKHMHTLFKSQVIHGSRDHSRRTDTVDGQGGEQHGPVDGASPANLADKELGRLQD